MIIGVTGSSGSGKSTLCEIAREDYGAKIIDADKIVKELNENCNSDYFKAIVNLFGKEILIDNKRLDKEKIADIIYNDDMMRKKLNDITFNYVIKEIRNKIIKYREEKYLIIDAPLLYESGLDKDCDIVIAMISDVNKKIERICKRDNISCDIAKKRLSIQNNDDSYMSKTKHIIFNNDDIEQMKKNFEKILEEK